MHFSEGNPIITFHNFHLETVLDPGKITYDADRHILQVTAEHRGAVSARSYA